MTAFRDSPWSAVLVMLLGVMATLAIPKWVDDFALIQITIYVVMAILAISQAFIWGFSGILCFGQASFFGLGAYTYALSVINMGESTVPVLLAIALPGLFALLLGYFMFYGRLSDVYMGVITLTVSLILSTPSIPPQDQNGALAMHPWVASMAYRPYPLSTTLEIRRTYSTRWPFSTSVRFPDHHLRRLALADFLAYWPCHCGHQRKRATGYLARL